VFCTVGGVAPPECSARQPPRGRLFQARWSALTDDDRRRSGPTPWAWSRRRSSSVRAGSPESRPPPRSWS